MTEQKQDQGWTKNGQPQEPEPVIHPTVMLTLIVTAHTLVGGPDDPNCFSLSTGDGWKDVRIVNMKLGPFRRVANSGRIDGGVEARLLTPNVAVLTDRRIPPHELHNDRWCTVCTPFAKLPHDQQRAYLRTYAPTIRDGHLSSWSAHSGVTNDDETVERFLTELRAIGAA